MTKIRFTLTAAAILAALTLCGCTDQKTDYNYDLIGGELNSDNEYTVDIRKDASDVTNDISSTDNTNSSSDISVADESNTSGEQNPTTSDTSSAPTSEPEDVTSTPSNAEVTQPVTSQPEASKVEEQTSEPTSDAATSETPKPSTSEKKDTTSNTTQKYDENGFPANPEWGDTFVDTTGQKWQFNWGFWSENNGAGVEVTDFWTGEVL